MFRFVHEHLRQFPFPYNSFHHFFHALWDRVFLLTFASISVSYHINKIEIHLDITHSTCAHTYWYMAFLDAIESKKKKKKQLFVSEEK